MVEKNGARKFEDLIAWQKARTVTKIVYGMTSTGAFAKDYELRDQIRRAAVSVMSNLAEGFERGGRTEFHQFLSMSKGSCAELRSQLYVALDAGYLDRKTFLQVLAQAEEVGRIIGGLRSAVQKQRDIGKKLSRRDRQIMQPPQSSVLSTQH
jgi:four helix bundle protein